MTRPTNADILRVANAQRGWMQQDDRQGLDAKATAASLRRQGFTFQDSWFWVSYRRAINPKPEFHSVMDDIPDEPPSPPGVIESAAARRADTDCKTFVFTCAQANTKVHSAFLSSLEVFCEHNNADLHIAQFTYNKAKHGKKSIKPGADQDGDADSVWFDPAIAPYVSDHSIQIAPDLVWCGELNILPTMKFPLSQFKTYTRHDSAVIPHAKMSMESIPVMPGVPARMLYTTGALTQRNYVQKTAGQVADFHHVFGALVVEVDDDGTWWVRQLNAKNNGEFYDLTTLYTPSAVVPNQRVEAITHGDLHFAQRNTAIMDAVFQPAGIMDQLDPKLQFFHDVIDFQARNHHEIKDGHYWHERFINGEDDVEKEFTDLANWLKCCGTRKDTDTFIVTSNHDQFVESWLRDVVTLKDPVNVTFWHYLNWYCHNAIEAKKEPRPFAFALLQKLMTMEVELTILHEDDSYLIGGEIEAGLHGHLGPNGARGSPKNLRTVGKANTAHTHSAGIVDGVYTAGTYSKLRMSYTKGLSSWSHSMILTYANNKRSILTIKKGKAWR